MKALGGKEIAEIMPAFGGDELAEMAPAFGAGVARRRHDTRHESDPGVLNDRTESASQPRISKPRLGRHPKANQASPGFCALPGIQFHGR